MVINAVNLIYLIFSFVYKFFQGCHSHAAHLIVKNLIGEVKKHKSTLNHDPFKGMRDFTEKCKTVVKFFDNHHKDREYLNRLQSVKEITKKSFRLPGDTRWGSAQAMFDSLNDSTGVLNEFVNRIVGDTDWKDVGTLEQRAKKAELYAILSGPSFGKNCKLCLKLLKPIDDIIVKLQSNDAPLSLAYHLFDTLSTKVDNVEGLTQHQRTYFKDVCKHYWLFVYEDATGVAYLLDPFYSGERLDKETETNIIELITSFPLHDGRENTQEEAESLARELNDYLEEWRLGKDLNSKAYTLVKAQVESGTFHPRQWWNINRKHYPHVAILADIVFNFPTSSASTERSFSANSFIHSKLRNRLLPEKSSKLTFIKLNLQHALTKTTDNALLYSLDNDEYDD